MARLDWLRAAARWVVPYEMWVRASRATRGPEEARPALPPLPPEVQGTLAANAALRGRHAGQRLFIVCNGPSVNRQDLRHLAGELVMTVSSGYKHPDYLAIKPRYHCLPQIAAPRMTQDMRIAWLTEMHEHIGAAELLLSESERGLVQGAGLFPERTVRYLYLHEHFDAFPEGQIIDLTRSVPSVQSVPIMCLMAALYMGANPIYLLGTEHDHFRTGRYEYFYGTEGFSSVDVNVASGAIVNSLYDEFEGLHRLWYQYRRMRRIAEANGIVIYNATAGGALDEFPRVEFASLFPVPAPAKAKGRQV